MRSIAEPTGRSGLRVRYAAANHFLADVVLVADREVMAPGIDAVAELAAGRQVFELSAVRAETDHAPRRLERRRIRAIGKAERGFRGRRRCRERSRRPPDLHAPGRSSCPDRRSGC